MRDGLDSAYVPRGPCHPCRPRPPRGARAGGHPGRPPGDPAFRPRKDGGNGPAAGAGTASIFVIYSGPRRTPPADTLPPEQADICCSDVRIRRQTPWEFLDRQMGRDFPPRTFDRTVL